MKRRILLLLQLVQVQFQFQLQLQLVSVSCARGSTSIPTRSGFGSSRSRPRSRFRSSRSSKSSTGSDSLTASEWTMFGGNTSGVLGRSNGIMRGYTKTSINTNMNMIMNMNMKTKKDVASICIKRHSIITRRNNHNSNIPLLLFINNYNCQKMIQNGRPSLFHSCTHTPKAAELYNKKNVICNGSRRSYNNNHNRGGDSDGDDNGEISFRWESLDRIGQWMTIDYDNIQINGGKTNADADADNDENIDRKRTNKRILLQNVFSPDEPSPVETKLIQDKLVYIKRDDLLHLRNSNVSGNKARKMLALNEVRAEEFPDVVVSYGGPQSNAMVALAAIVQSKNRELMERAAANEHKYEYEHDNEHEYESSDLEMEALFSTSNSNDSVDEIESDGWLMVDRDEDGKEDQPSKSEKKSSTSRTTATTTKTTTMDPPSPQKRFVYYTKKLPRYLRNQPNGNLLRSLTLGMELVQLNHGMYNDLFGGADGGSSVAPIDAPTPGRSLWVPQGGACGLASQGAKLMANEIVSFWAERGKGMPLSVCVPGGTCTTAMLLSREINLLLKDDIDDSDVNDDEGAKIQLDIQVVVVPCVGDSGYARRQMKALDLSTGGNGIDDIPRILKPPKNKNYFRFGEPNADILKTFLRMKDDHGVYLDLLYGAPAWSVILEHWKEERYGNDSEDSPIKGRQLMYVHSGGLEGISSQLTRYKHKGLIDAGEVQS